MSTDCCRLIQYLAHVQYLLVWNRVSEKVVGVVAIAMNVNDVLCKQIVSLENTQI